MIIYQLEGKQYLLGLCFPPEVTGRNQLHVCVCVLGLEETSLSTSTSLETPSTGFYLTIFSADLETGEGNRIT